MSQKTTPVTTEATDDSLNISNNVDNKHSDQVSPSHQTDETPSTSIGPHVNSPSISASDRLAPSRNMVSPTQFPRRRYSSVSSVDSVAAGRIHGRPGFGSTPPKRHRSQLSATFVPRKSIPFASQGSTPDGGSSLPLKLCEHVPSPSSKTQKRVALVSSGHDAGNLSGSPSFSQDHVGVPSGASNAAVTKASGSTPTGKTKRRKFVIGF